MCWCGWWCGSGCGCRKARPCCKKQKTNYADLLAMVGECEATDGAGELLVYNDWQYCKVTLSTLLGDWSLSGTTLDVTGNGIIWGNLTVWGCVNADCLNISWDADFNGNVDFTWANLTFDNGELCSEVSRCVMNDASVIAAIEAVANWVGWDFGCADVAACISSNAAVQNALAGLLTGWTNAFQTALLDFLQDNGCCGWGGWDWLSCPSTTDTGTYLQQTLALKNGQTILFWPAWWNWASATYTANETGYMVLKSTWISGATGEANVYVNWTLVWVIDRDSDLNWPDRELALWVVNSGDTIELINEWWDGEVFNLVDAAVCIAVGACWVVT